MRYLTKPFCSLKVGDCFLLNDGTIAIKTHGYLVNLNNGDATSGNARNWHTDKNLIVKGNAEVIPILLLGCKNNDAVSFCGEINRNREIYFVINSIVIE